MSIELTNAEELLSKGEREKALRIISRVENAIWRYFFRGDYEKGIEILLQCKKLYEKIGRKLNIANNLSYLSSFYSQKGEKNEGLKYAKKSLELYEQLNDQAGIAKSYSLLAYNYGFNVNGNLELAIEYAKRSLSIKEIDPMTKAENLKNLAIIYGTQGRLNEALQFAEEGYILAQEKKIDYLSALCSELIGATYRLQGDLKRALEYLENGLTHARNSGFVELIGWALYSLTLTHLDLDSYEQAQEYLKQFEEAAKKTKDKTTFKMYLMAKGLMLKASGRSRDRAEAENLFKQIVADEITNPQVFLNAVSTLCEILLEELEMSNNKEIISELEPLITKLLSFAEKTHSFMYTCLTKGFQAKL
ncbi:MAG: tetratricopeptide repeat protein [Candidatus Hodarchaeota archaeon]